ncbi:hypothetical protein EDC04DRAFT_2633487 [Pisolithus marmoratus]|nr:hypothetical protein EDC04DRAFT_2633487 [Pisolithus marmoratus]
MAIWARKSYSAALREFIPQEHPNRHLILINLANLLHERFEREDTTEDLDEIITMRRAEEGCFGGSGRNLISLPHRCKPLLRLAESLYTKDQKLNSVHDIDEAHSLVHTASQLPPQGDPGPFDLFRSSVSDIEKTHSFVPRACCPAAAFSAPLFSEPRVLPKPPSLWKHSPVQFVPRV